jgi:hypothetical protein
MGRAIEGIVPEVNNVKRHLGLIRVDLSPGGDSYSNDDQPEMKKAKSVVKEAFGGDAAPNVFVEVPHHGAWAHFAALDDDDDEAAWPEGWSDSRMPTGARTNSP